MKQVLAGLLVMAVCSFESYGQQAVSSSDSTKVITAPIVHLSKPKPPKPLRKEMSVGVRLNTDGWSAFTQYGWLETKDKRKVDMFHNVLYLEIELAEKKDAREVKTPSENTNSLGGSNSYIYGKINNLYTVKIGGVGYRWQLAGKPDVGAVSIHWTNTAGMVAGLLKPYYLNVTTESAPIKYSTNTEQEFLTPSVIEGGAGFSKGWNELKVIPGGYLRSALHFDFSTNRKNVLGVEAGGSLEFYSQKMQLMLFQDPKAFYANLFVSFQYGRRW